MMFINNITFYSVISQNFIASFFFFLPNIKNIKYKAEMTGRGVCKKTVNKI